MHEAEVSLGIVLGVYLGGYDEGLRAAVLINENFEDFWLTIIIFKFLHELFPFVRFPDGSHVVGGLIDQRLHFILDLIAVERFI